MSAIRAKEKYFRSTVQSKGDCGGESQVGTDGGERQQDSRKRVGGGGQSSDAVWFRDGGAEEKTGGREEGC